MDFARGMTQRAIADHYSRMPMPEVAPARAIFAGWTVPNVYARQVAHKFAEVPNSRERRVTIFATPVT